MTTELKLGQMVTISFTIKGVSTSLPAKIVQVEKKSVVVSYERDGIWLLERITRE
jgi:hypothetical protein